MKTIPPDRAHLHDIIIPLSTAAPTFHSNLPDRARAGVGNTHVDRSSHPASSCHKIFGWCASENWKYEM
ncbi:MAG: hypothetical protein IPP40_18525 [bacterium]|nr:hypothetical protein [bacterium]